MSDAGPWLPVCGDDESLDVNYDKAIGIDCNAVRTAVDARRSLAQRESADRLYQTLHTSLRRCCVSREQLVLRMRPHAEQGLPTDPVVLRRMDRMNAMLLCDRATREIATRRYIEEHTDCLNPEDPPSGDAIPAGGAR